MRTYTVDTDDETSLIYVQSATTQTAWTQTRELLDDELATTILDSHKQPRWSIRQPTRGWYCRLEACSPQPVRNVSLEPSKSVKGGLNLALPDPANPKDKLRLELVPTEATKAASSWSPKAILNKVFGTDLSLSFVCCDVSDPAKQYISFTDRSSISLSGKTHGQLALADDLIDASGLEPSFWVALALAFLQFTTDREAYEMASQD